MPQPHPDWRPDSELAGFEARTLRFPADYDGPVVATVVRRTAVEPTTKAVLYIHGYTDYFFQRHFAEACNRQGYNFYALDLRKYGRSLGQNRHPSFCRDVREYFSEISAALRIVSEEDGNEWVVLNGHSTGGLIAALYADSGAERQRINALFLNSPFFEFNLAPKQLRMVAAATKLAPLVPYFGIQGKQPVPYMQSIHASSHGEWQFNLAWRPMNGFPPFAGWLRAITIAHQKVRQGLRIACPVLVMHSDKSIYGPIWRPDFQTGDSILNVEHIRDGSKYLGPNVKVIEIKDGLHDLMLSRPDVRERAMDEFFDWLASLQPALVERTGT